MVILETKSKERRVWSVLVNKSDYNHNYTVIDNISELASSYQNTGLDQPNHQTWVVTYHAHVPLAMHVKADMWRHQCSCSKGNGSKAISKAISKAKRIAPATTGKLLLPTKTKARVVYANVVLPMQNDEVNSTVEMDLMIMAYGASLYDQYGNENHNHNSITLATNSESNDEKMKKTQRFLDLHNTAWSERISSKSHSTLRDRQYNKPRLLTLVEDVVKMTTFLYILLRTTSAASKMKPKLGGDMPR